MNEEYYPNEERPWLSKLDKHERRPWVARLEEMGVGRDVVEWFGECENLYDAWGECERGDWMIEIAAQTTSVESKRGFIECLCECVRQVLPLYESVEPSDDRVRDAIKVASQCVWGAADHIEVKRAAAAAGRAARAAFFANDRAHNAAAYVAEAAAHVADTALYVGEFPSDTADYATEALSSASLAVEVADGAGARFDALRRFADVIRIYYPEPPARLEE